MSKRKCINSLEEIHAKIFKKLDSYNCGKIWRTCFIENFNSLPKETKHMYLQTMANKLQNVSNHEEFFTSSDDSAYSITTNEVNKLLNRMHKPDILLNGIYNYIDKDKNASWKRNELATMLENFDKEQTVDIALGLDIPLDFETIIGLSNNSNKTSTNAHQSPITYDMPGDLATKPIAQFQVSIEQLPQNDGVHQEMPKVDSGSDTGNDGKLLNVSNNYGAMKSERRDGKSKNGHSYGYPYGSAKPERKHGKGIFGIGLILAIIGCWWASQNDDEEDEKKRVYTSSDLHTTNNVGVRVDKAGNNTQEKIVESSEMSKGEGTIIPGLGTSYGVKDEIVFPAQMRWDGKLLKELKKDFVVAQHVRDLD